jgi:HKD family nuclease
MGRPLRVLTVASFVVFAFELSAAAQERLCDPQFESCRGRLIELIRKEKALLSTSPSASLGIDVAFWFMQDSWYATELINAHKAGVPVRILVDQRANATKAINATMLAMLRDGGIPMREKYASEILHFKMMYFHGQGMLQFSKANYTPSSFVYDLANVNYFDEAIFFTDDDNITNSFLRRFDDLWTDTSAYRNFANVVGPPVRRCPACVIHASMNFPPLQNFSTRSVARYDAERLGIDAIAYRITDDAQSNAIIRAVTRGVRVRLITEPLEYRDPKRLWHSKHVDRLWMAGVQIKQRQHAGLTHQASFVLHGLGEVIFGSSNLTIASATRSDEHNYFYNPSLGKPWFFQWFANNFENKWNNAANYVTFHPQPPGTPAYRSPMNLAANQSSTVTLTWDGGTWAHLYDIYLGTTPTPPMVAANLKIGSPVAGQLETYTVRNLQPGTTYYWRIVGKTWAQLAKNGPLWSFTTAGSGTGAAGNSPYGGTPVTLPGVVQAENFDEGAQGVAYSDTSAGNSGGAHRVTNVDIGATSDPGSAGLYVGWTRAGEWLKYTVNVAQTRTYTLKVRVANVGSGARFRVEVDGVDRTGVVAVPNTGGWSTWQTVSLSGIPLTQGLRAVRVVMVASNAQNAGVGNYGFLSFE